MEYTRNILSIFLFFVTFFSAAHNLFRNYTKDKNSNYNLHQTIAQSRGSRLLTLNKPQILSHFTAVIFFFFILNILRFIHFLPTVFAKKIKNTKCSN